MDKKTQTIKTYNDSAQALAKKFDDLGVRASDIKETFSLVSKDHPNVLEIGCGNGRDAEEIVQHTNQYLGIDISDALIALARQKVPQANFEVADIEEYAMPGGLDIIFCICLIDSCSQRTPAADFGKGV